MIPTSYISSIERGQSTPSVIRLVKIASIFNMHVDELLKGTDYLG